MGSLRDAGRGTTWAIAQPASIRGGSLDDVWLTPTPGLAGAAARRAGARTRADLYAGASGYQGGPLQPGYPSLPCLHFSRAHAAARSAWQAGWRRSRAALQHENPKVNGPQLPILGPSPYQLGPSRMRRAGKGMIPLPRPLQHPRDLQEFDSPDTRHNARSRNRRHRRGVMVRVQAIGLDTRDAASCELAEVMGERAERARVGAMRLLTAPIARPTDSHPRLYVGVQAARPCTRQLDRARDPSPLCRLCVLIPRRRWIYAFLVIASLGVLPLRSADEAYVRNSASVSYKTWLTP